MPEPDPPTLDQFNDNNNSTYPCLLALDIPSQTQETSMNVDGMSTQHYHRTQPLMPGAVDSMSVGSHAGQSQRSRNEHINPAVTPSLALSQEGGQQTTYQQIQRDHEGIERVQQEQEEEATRRAWIALLYAHHTELPTLGMGRNNRSGRGRSALRHLELGTLASSSLRSRTIPPQPSYQWVHKTPPPGTLYLPQSRQPAHEGLQYGDLSALLHSLPAKASPTQAHPALPLLELWAREREERDTQQGAPTFVQPSADVQSTTEQTNALQDRSLLFPNVSQAQMEPEMQRAETVMQRAAANAERAAANVQRAAAEARLAAADNFEDMWGEIYGLNRFECLICEASISLNTDFCDACFKEPEFWSPAQVLRAQIAKSKRLPCVKSDSYLICEGEEMCRCCLHRTMGITAVWKFR